MRNLFMPSMRDGVMSRWNRLRSVPVLACLFAVLGAGVIMLPGTARASYKSTMMAPDSQIDPAIFRINERKFLGGKVDGNYVLRDASGKTFKLGGMLGRKPLILVLSYFTCDGACSVINRTLANTLKKLDRWKIGKDYNVLTVSIDPHDTPATMREFRKKMGFEQLPKGWRMATMRNRKAIDRLAASIGFKFFWSPRDRIFLHPSVYTILSPKGRIMRYLYAGKVDPYDVQLALTKAMSGEVSPVNLVDFVVAACHSYNYKDGKYTLNIPLFVAIGGLVVGVTMMVGGFMIVKRRKNRDGKGKGMITA